MKALADYVHAKGLKFGVYSDAGTGTCQNRPGSLGYEEKDAQQYAAWGVDYLKYDWCNAEGVDPKVVYPKMSKALHDTGRPIVFSMCEWGSHQPWRWAENVAQLWRTTGDIQDCWDCKKDWGGLGWVQILDLEDSLAQYAGPGHWNDPDMLEVGNGGMNDKEYQAHFSFWCMLAAPLMAGNDIIHMPKVIKEILTNKEVIAIDQDPLGKQGTKVKDSGDFEIWSKPLKNGDTAVILFNRSEKPGSFTVDWKALGMQGNHKIRDLWKHQQAGSTGKNTRFEVEGHSALFFRLSA